MPKLWHPFSGTTINVGRAAVRALRIGFDMIRTQLGRMPDFVLLQEMSDRNDVRRLLEELGYFLIEGDEIGQRATPVALHSETMTILRFEDTFYAKVLGRVFVGPGAGPSWLKPKWVQAPRAVHIATRRRTRLTSLHAPASSQRKLRARLARQMFIAILRVFSWAAIEIVGGDFNTKKRLLRWLTSTMRKAGWTSSDLEGGPLPTHERQVYDQIWWRRTLRLIFIRHFVTAVGSDHLAKTVVWSLRARRRLAR